MHPSLIRALAIALLLPALANAQSFNPDPSSPTASRQATTLQSAPATRAAPVSSSLDDRPQSPQSPAHKPAKAKPAPANGANAAADRSNCTTVAAASFPVRCRSAPTACSTRAAAATTAPCPAATASASTSRRQSVERMAVA
ncbi:hypothetical protein [Xanthomonas graminis]|uniref:hypothetical protein n=1 Tax=Xanthomonas graminis TaxID=3390026 RepID=UPI00396473AD